jgi:hypothetical protein
VLQPKVVKIDVLVVTVPSIIRSIERMVEEPGKMYKKVDAALKNFADNGHACRYDKPVHRHVFEIVRKDYLKDIVFRLKDRFTILPVLSAAHSFLSPRLFSSWTQEDMVDCEEIKASLITLVDHFCQAPAEGRDPPFTRAAFISEWSCGVAQAAWQQRDKKKEHVVKQHIDATNTNTSSSTSTSNRTSNSRNSASSNNSNITVTFGLTSEANATVADVSAVSSLNNPTTTTTTTTTTASTTTTTTTNAVVADFIRRRKTTRSSTSSTSSTSAADPVAAAAAIAAAEEDAAAHLDKEESREKTVADMMSLLDEESGGSEDDADAVREFLWGASKKKKRRRKRQAVEVEVPFEAADFIATFLDQESNPSFELQFPASHVMRVYLVVILSSAECERIFSRLKLVKTRLRNRLKNVTLEQILQVALNGPSLREFIDNGMMKQALTYFFSKTKRNAKAPSQYTDHFKKQTLQKLVWGTQWTYPNRNGPSAEDVHKELNTLNWPAETEEDEEEEEKERAEEALASELEKLEHNEDEKMKKRSGKKRRRKG